MVLGLRAGIDGPYAVKSTALQEFNRGLFDYLIATDDLSVSKKRPAADDGDDAAAAAAKGGKQGGRKRRKQGDERDGEFGVTRCVWRSPWPVTHMSRSP